MPSSFLHIALAQFNIRWEDPAANCQVIENLLDTDEKIDFLLLPEMWSTGFTMNTSNAAESVPGPALSWMIETARQRNFVIGGSIAVEENGRYYNRWYGVYPDGRIVSYEKKHLFSYGKENQHYDAGDAHLVMDISGWKIMPIVCYDLRFPVWCRNTTDYDLMVVVANWPSARIHHWDALLKARAIENQSYVAAVNRIGIDGSGLAYPGHSGIHDMNGTTLLDLKDEEKLGVYKLDKHHLTEYRDHFRFLQDRDTFSF